jgi:hypothetical protein
MNNHIINLDNALTLLRLQRYEPLLSMEESVKLNISIDKFDQ